MYSGFVAPLTWILSIFVLLFLYTKIIGPIPFAVNSVTTQKTTTFDVQGEGKAYAKPDIATLNAGISAQAGSVKAAQDQINGVINKVTLALKQIGIDQKDIQTSNYNINPTYDYSGSAQRITGYSANTNLIIKVRNLDNVNKAIDTATANGANQISGLSFDADDKTKLQNEARQKAVDDAKRKAAEAAKMAGFKLGRIINYTEISPDFPRVIPFPMGAVKASEDMATQVEPGSAEVAINVVLSYEIE